MTEVQKPKDLTAQLAAVVIDWWSTRHWAICSCEGAPGRECKYPKPSALVAYEQGQVAKAESRIPPSVGVWDAGHAAELPNPSCACQTCEELRADGAGEQPAGLSPQASGIVTPSPPALAYVLTRDMNEPGRSASILQVYGSETLASTVCACLQQIPSVSRHTYRVHAVPRVE